MPTLSQIEGQEFEPAHKSVVSPSSMKDATDVAIAIRFHNAMLRAEPGFISLLMLII